MSYEYPLSFSLSLSLSLSSPDASLRPHQISEVAVSRFLHSRQIVLFCAATRVPRFPSFKIALGGQSFGRLRTMECQVTNGPRISEYIVDASGAAPEA